MGWVIVEFVDRRRVFCGGQDQGFNRDENGDYRALRVGDGWQTFWLADPLDFTPDTQRVNVPADSGPIAPFRVVFARKG